MGIFSRKDDEAGAPSQPEDVQGDGPVTLEDRTAPGGQGSPDTNQAKAEPMDVTGTHSEPLAPPSLDQMNVGAGNPQLPSHPDALRSGLSPTGAYAHEPAGRQPTDLSGTGTTPDETRPSIDTTTSTGRAPGPEKPVQLTSGAAHRAPGLDGTTPEGESIDTDVEGGAARMGPQALDSTPGQMPSQGEDQSVPSSGTAATPGTSEEHRIVSGIRLPEPDDA